MISRHSLPAILTCVLSPLLAANAHARTWTVLPGGGGDAPTIQAAIDQGAPGDSALLGEGVFVESVLVDIPFSIIGAPIGEGSSIDADGDEYCVRTDGLIAFLLLDSLTLINAASVSDGYGSSGGFAVRGDGNLLMQDCTVTTTGMHDTGGLSWYGQARIEDCEFYGTSRTMEPLIRGQGASLVIQRCEFRDLTGTAILALADQTEVTESKFHRLWGNPGVIAPYFGLTRVSRCFFVDIAGYVIGRFDPPIHSPPSHRGLPPEVSVESSTIVRAWSALAMDSELAPLTGFSQNVVTNCWYAVQSVTPLDAAVFSCNNMWGSDVNWQPPDLTGQNGNISEFPHYCDAVFFDHSLGADSPCLPQNNSCNLLMGVFEQGCGPTALAPRSWGAIKAMYR